MKTFKLIVIGMLFFLSGAINAQVYVNVNIGSPPLWGPVGYTEVRYYYLPDVECYYDIQTSMFIYYGGGVWIHRGYLPKRYSNYDLYSGYKVVMMDYHGDAPYTNFKEHKMKYVKGYRGEAQKTIGEKPGKGSSKTQSKSNKKVSQSNGKSAGSGNDKNSKKGQSNGGGKSKKK